MPKKIHIALLHTLKPELKKFFKDDETEIQFLTNIAFSFETEEELRLGLDKLVITEEHIKLFSSKDHESLFEHSLLNFSRVSSLNQFQVSLINQSPTILI